MLEGFLQVVGEIFGRLGPSPDVHAPFAAAVCDQHTTSAKLVDDLYDQGGNSVAESSNFFCTFFYCITVIEWEWRDVSLGAICGPVRAGIVPSLRRAEITANSWFR
jgi:hypothetical protein